MKKILISAIVLFNVFIINLYANGIALSTQSDTNTYSWIKGRQIISINLSPGYAVLFPSLLNTVFNNYQTFTGLAGIDLGSIDQYLNAIEAKGNFWYVPNISYTLLLHPRIGIEIGFGVQAMSFQLGIPRDKVGELANSFLPNNDQNGDIGNLISGNLDTLIGSDTYLKASLIYFPATIGIKFFGGKNRQVVNTFRFGLETFMYDVETENGITGVKTKRHTIDTTMYFSYELGWTIELFPTREWPVKPYIDISILEIGYYVRSGIPGLYGDIREGIGFFGSGLVDISSTIPTWESFPRWVNYVSAIKISFFPRIGFSLRF
ncbi:hypothetical protein [Brachyspira murdochii]|uniref:hypothetical protein n=1 Tax=Brachyspira murdochii TaxID=84378 RepID=UPI0012F4D17C|nr:hypothetical protein [Brachyspira murdochii]